MPFLPMRPSLGRTLRTPALVKGFIKEMEEEGDWWVIQPDLNGVRACLAVVNDKVHIQDEEGRWYRQQVRNAQSFLNLPNRTCLDGEIFQYNFYPSDALAVDGKSFMPATAAEREVIAYQLVRLLHHPWMFERPDRRWLMRRWQNLPQFLGVIKKRARSPYELADAAGVRSRDWLRRVWDNRKIV